MNHINIKIRKGIYETNSSSAHSFTMGDERNEKTNDLVISDSGIIEIPTLTDFPRKTNSQTDKVAYLLLFAGTYYWSYKNKEYRDFYETLKKVICDFTGATGISYTPNSYEKIDHQSRDIIDPRDLVDPDFLKEFIFNPGTWLFVEWDGEKSYDPDFYEKNLGQEYKKEKYLLRYVLPGLDVFEVTITLQDIIDSEVLEDKFSKIFDKIYYDKNKFFKSEKDDLDHSNKIYYYYSVLPLSGIREYYYHDSEVIDSLTIIFRSLNTTGREEICIKPEITVL